MMLPEFNSDGYLDLGIYLAQLEEMRLPLNNMLNILFFSLTTDGNVRVASWRYLVMATKIKDDFELNVSYEALARLRRSLAGAKKSIFPTFRKIVSRALCSCSKRSNARLRTTSLKKTETNKQKNKPQRRCLQCPL